jgi:hypothetical protein
MIRRSSALLAITCMAAAPYLSGCPKKPPPPPVDTVDAAPAPADTSSGPTVLQPLDDDLGVDAAEAGPPKKVAKPGSANAARIKQCCAAIRNQAKSMGTSPEANLLVGFAMQCDQFAVAATSGNAPEFAAFRNAIAGHTLPPACQGW